LKSENKFELLQNLKPKEPKVKPQAKQVKKAKQQEKKAYKNN